MWKLIFNLIMKRKFPGKTVESLTRGELRAVESEAIRTLNRTKGQKGDVFQFPSGGKDRVPVNQQFTPPREGHVFEILDDDAFKELKGDYFRKLMTNTDEDVQAFAKRVIDNKQDVKLEKLTQGQRKEFMNMVDDRITLGNRKFMEKYTDDFPLPKELDEDFASGGIARVGMLMGGFTKAQVLIQMLKNTLKGSKDAYVKKTFPNFIKELQKNPELALDENVWKQFTTGLPKNQRLIVHSDDSVDFFRQTEFGPHNIESTLKFQKKHNLSRDQANKILQMEPEDRVLEMKRLETIADKSRTKQAAGGIAGQLHLNEGGRVPMIFGGSAGLKAMWKQMMKGINKGRDKPIKKLFPGLSARDKAMEKIVIGTPGQKAFRAKEKALKIEGIDILINRLKHDKKILERQAKNKEMGDPGLDFLMKDLEKSMSEAYAPHLKKYTDIDKDILQLETIKKNLTMKGRKLHAAGGLAKVLGV